METDLIKTKIMETEKKREKASPQIFVLVYIY